MKGKVKCTCGWSWNKSDSSKKDMYICHECGRDNSNNMKNGGWLDDIPQAQRGKKKIKSPQYIDITKEYDIPQFTEQYINKAIELDKKYPGAKFVCDANGCADIASRAANAMGYDFGKANAWEYGNRSDIVFTNPSYVEELENPTGPLHDPTSYDVPKELLGMKNVLVGLNRKNNLLDAKGKKVRNVPDAQQIAAAKNRQEANDSTDYANQDLYEGSRGYEHIGYMLDNNNLLHGTGANEDHPAFFVVDDINDGINLSGYGKYEPVEVIAEPTMLQSLGNKAKALGNKVKAALFEDATVDKLKPPTKKKKNGGWLDNYGEEANANEGHSSASKEWVGDGYSNVGRNYSPAWGGQFQNGGKAPLYVKSKNDPRYKAYQDSLALYDFQEKVGGKSSKWLKSVPKNKKGMVSEKDWENYSKRTEKFTSKKELDKQWDAFNRLTKLNKKEPGKKYPFKQELKILPNGFDTYVSDFEKPQQQVIVKKQEERKPIQAIQNNIQPEGIENDFSIDAQLPVIRPDARIPKYYDVEDYTQGSANYINNQTNYRTSDLSTLSEQSPNNKRKITPRYQIGGNVYPVNYVPQAQGGMSMPGAVGFTYARTKGIPSNGPYAKKTMASAQNGKEMQYYQNGLDWKPKTISRDGSVIKDDRGQWDHPGEITEINSNDITMEGVPYDVLGISDTGDTKLMKPGKNYKFKGKKVTEFPMAKNGLRQEQKSLQNLDNLLNFTNYNKPQPGGWLNKYN